MITAWTWAVMSRLPVTDNPCVVATRSVVLLMGITGTLVPEVVACTISILKLPYVKCIFNGASGASELTSPSGPVAYRKLCDLLVTSILPPFQDRQFVHRPLKMYLTLLDNPVPSSASIFISGVKTGSEWPYAIRGDRVTLLPDDDE